MPLRTVLAAVDFSPVTQAVVATAARIAAAGGATVHLLHVGPADAPGDAPDAGRAEVAEALRRARRELLPIQRDLKDKGGAVTALLGQGDPADVILRQARELSADLVVVGRRGAGGRRDAVVGSVCRGVLRGAACPVVVVPEPHDPALA